MLVCIATLAILLPRSHGFMLPDPHPEDIKWVSVAATQFSLVDESRKDPWHPDENRKLMVDLFLPLNATLTTNNCSNLYMPDQTARFSNGQFFGDERANVFEQAIFHSGCRTSEVLEGKNLPIVFLEPGVGVTRLIYRQLARQMSSVGFAVVTIDHPYDASIVEFDKASGFESIFNNGTITLDPYEPIKEWNATMTKVINTRVADIKFVLEQLKPASTLERQFPDFTFGSPLDIDSYTIVGHGVGGTVATWLSISDPRARFSINLSGSAPLLKTPTEASIYFFGREGYRRENDIHWKDSWKYLHGKATEWDMMKAGQMDMSDLPFIADFAKKELGKDVKGKGMGAIGPNGFHITSCFVEAYLRTELRGERTRIGNCVRLFPDMVPYPGAV